MILTAKGTIGFSQSSQKNGTRMRLIRFAKTRIYADFFRSIFVFARNEAISLAESIVSVVASFLAMT
jgi:hypothetical protein